MAFKFLPKVKKFCFCIHDLKHAAYIIAGYSILVGAFSCDVFLAPCSNIRNYTTYSEFTTVLSMYLLFITGLILIGASIHLIYTLYKNDPYTSCFVEMTIWRSLIAFMAHLSMLSTMSKEHRFRCDDELFFTFGHPKIYFYILFLIDIPHGLLCFYFAVVVNSLPTSHQLSPLRQQPTSAKSPQAPTSLKLSQSPQAATSPQPPLSPKSPTSPTPPKSP